MSSSCAIGTMFFCTDWCLSRSMYRPTWPPHGKRGLIPNGLEMSQPLFPNLGALRSDAKGLRWETRDSFRLPMEITGPEIGILLLTGI